MAVEKRTTRQKKLDRIIASVGHFGLSETYDDEETARRHLVNAINELREAADKLIETKP